MLYFVHDIARLEHGEQIFPVFAGWWKRNKFVNLIDPNLLIVRWSFARHTTIVRQFNGFENYIVQPITCGLWRILTLTTNKETKKKNQQRDTNIQTKYDFMNSWNMILMNLWIVAVDCRLCVVRRRRATCQMYKDLKKNVFAAFRLECVNYAVKLYWHI